MFAPYLMVKRGSKTLLVVSCASLLAMVCLSVARAQQASPSASPVELKWGMFRFPREMFTEPDLQNRTTGWKPKPEVAVLPGGRNAFDASALMRSTGINLPAGSSAVYFESRGELVLHSSTGDLDLCDTIIESMPIDIPPVISVEFSLIEYQLPGTHWNSPTPLAYAELEKLASTTIYVLDRVTGTGLSGVWMKGEHVANAQYEKKTAGKRDDDLAPLRAGEKGMRFRLQPTRNPYDNSIQVIADIAFRAQLAAERPQTGTSGNTHFESVLWAGCPVVVQSFTEPGKDGKFVALILRIDFANFGGWRPIAH